MSSLLKRWLNDEVGLSEEVVNLEEDLASGFLLGELLSLHGVQSDFAQFAHVPAGAQEPNKCVENYGRLRKSFARIGVQFDVPTAEALMRKGKGVAPRLLYSVKAALEALDKQVDPNARMAGTRKGLSQLEVTQSRPAVQDGGVYKKLMDTQFESLMRVKADNKNALLEGLHTLKFAEEAARQAQGASDAAREAQQMREAAVKDRRDRQLSTMASQRKQKAAQLEADMAAFAALRERRKALERADLASQQAAANVALTKSLKNLRTVKEDVLGGLDGFEANLERLGLNKAPELTEEERALLKEGNRLEGTGRDQHLESLRGKLPDGRQQAKEGEVYVKRLAEAKKVAERERLEREIRRRKVALEVAETQRERERRRDEQAMVESLQRTSAEEQHLRARLEQLKREKDVLREGRLLRQQQVQERRKRDFDEVVEHDRRVAELSRAALAETRRQQRERFASEQAERDAKRRAKHTAMCREMALQLVGVAERFIAHKAKLLPGALVPRSEMRGWVNLFVQGAPLYVPHVDPLPTEEEVENLADTEAKVLNDVTYAEYLDCRGQWALQDAEGGAVDPNPVLGSVVAQIDVDRNPPPEPFYPPSFGFRTRVAIVGKPYSGKTTLARAFAEKHRLTVLEMDKLLSEAIELSKAPAEEAEGAGDADAEPAPVVDEEAAKKAERRVKRGELGRQADEQMSKGKPASDEVLVALAVLAAEDADEGNGFVLDGFPVSAKQGQLLEKALVDLDLERERLELEAQSLLAPPPDAKGKKAPKKTQKSVEPLRSGMNLILRVDAPDEACIERVAGRRIDPITGKVYHVTLRPPADSDLIWDRLELLPGDEDTGLAHSRLKAAQTGVSAELGKWLDKFDVAKVVDNAINSSNASFEDMFITEAEQLLLPVLEENARREAGKMCKAEVMRFIELADVMQEERAAKRAALEAEKAKADKERRNAEDFARCNVLMEEDPSRDLQAAMAIVAAERKAEAEAMEAEAAAAKAEGAASTAAADVPPPPRAPSPPFPEREIVVRPKRLDQELASVLKARWVDVEERHRRALCRAFHVIRGGRMDAVEHYHSARQDFLSFLRRRDAKSALVSEFQAKFNDPAIDEDMRRLPEVKQELHMRVAELRDAVWDVCDAKHEENQAESEQMGVSEFGQDQINLLGAYVKLLVQAECDRHQATRQLVKAFSGFAFPPAGDIKPDPKAEAAEAAEMEMFDVGKGIGIKGLAYQAPKDAKGKGPRYAWLEHVVVSKSKRGKGEVDALPELPAELVTAIQNCLAVVKEWPEPMQPPVAEGAVAEGDSAAAAVATAAEGADAAQAGADSEEESPVLWPLVTPDVASTSQKEEDRILVHRIGRIVACAKLWVDEIVAYEKDTKALMYEWVEKRYRAECDAASALAKACRETVEAEDFLPPMISLEDEDFIVNHMSRTLPHPLGPPAKAPEERVFGELGYRLSTVRSLCDSLRLMAPSGVISLTALVDMFVRLCAPDAGGAFVVPERLQGIEAPATKELLSPLLVGGSAAVDWKVLITRMLMQVFSAPTFSHLAKARNALYTTPEYHGVATLEKLLSTELWFESELDAEEFPGHADAIKSILFSLFCFSREMPPKPKEESDSEESDSEESDSEDEEGVPKVKEPVPEPEPVYEDVVDTSTLLLHLIRADRVERQVDLSFSLLADSEIIEESDALTAEKLQRVLCPGAYDADGVLPVMSIAEMEALVALASSQRGAIAITSDEFRVAGGLAMFAKVPTYKEFTI